MTTTDHIKSDQDLVNDARDITDALIEVTNRLLKRGITLMIQFDRGDVSTRRDAALTLFEAQKLLSSFTPAQKEG